MEDLVFDLSDNQIVTIKGDHKEFKDTPYEGTAIEIDVEPITREQYAAIQRKHTSIQNRIQVTDDLAVESEVFCKCIKAWRHMVDRSGNPIPCTENTKRIIANKKWQFAGLVNKAMLDLSNQQDELDSERLKNS